MILYNEVKLFFPNPLNRFSLVLKNKTLKYTSDRPLLAWFFTQEWRPSVIELGD